MQKQLIVLLLLSFIFLIDGQNCKCKTFANNIYQLTLTLPNLQPFYSLITLLPNGIFYEVSNTEGGQHVAEIGVDIQYTAHTGYYECLTGNTVHLNDFGYIFPAATVPALAASGAIAIHDYILTFLNNDNRVCTGQLRYAFFTTGSNPLDSSNTPIFKGAVANVTCQLFNGRSYQWNANNTA